jgi:spermidine synthase
LRDARIGVVGLGAGELAAYGKSGQQWTFYEIDPEIVGLATNPAFFTYLSDSAASVDVVLADGRVGLARDTGGPFAVLVLDAFTSDAIPTHLLTREAFSMYRRNLREDGLLAFHVSNRFIDLRPVVAGLAQSIGFTAWARFDQDSAGRRSSRFPSDWVVVGRVDAIPSPIAADVRWTRLATADGSTWSDEWAPLIRRFKWRSLIDAVR